MEDWIFSMFALYRTLGHLRISNLKHKAMNSSATAEHEHSRTQATLWILQMFPSKQACALGVHMLEGLVLCA